MDLKYQTLTLPLTPTLTLIEFYPRVFSVKDRAAVNYNTNQTVTLTSIWIACYLYVMWCAVIDGHLSILFPRPLYTELPAQIRKEMISISIGIGIGIGDLLDRWQMVKKAWRCCDTNTVKHSANVNDEDDFDMISYIKITIIIDYANFFTLLRYRRIYREC